MSMKIWGFAAGLGLVLALPAEALAETVSMKKCLEGGNALYSDSSCPPHNLACHQKLSDGTLGQKIGCADRIDDLQVGGLGIHSPVNRMDRMDRIDRLRPDALPVFAPSGDSVGDGDSDLE